VKAKLYFFEIRFWSLYRVYARDWELLGMPDAVPLPGNRRRAVFPERRIGETWRG